MMIRFIFLLLFPFIVFCQVDTLGHTTVGASLGGISGDAATLMDLQTANYTGSLSKMFVYHGAGTTSELKVSVFLDDGDNIPDAGDRKIATSSVIPSVAFGWAEGNFSSGEIVQGQKYWIMLNRNPASPANWQYHYNSTGSNYWNLSATGFWASPPDNLGTVTWTGITREISAYVTIERFILIENKKQFYKKNSNFNNY